MKFLVVDDSSTMRRIIKNTLARLGHKEVVEGEDGEQGWKALQENDDIDAIMHKVDALLYQAKQNGRNQVAFK